MKDVEFDAPNVHVSCVVMRGAEVLLTKLFNEKWELPTVTIGKYGLMITAAKEAVLPTGVTVQPVDGTMFLSEYVSTEQKVHDIYIYILGNYLEGEPNKESLWIDVRKLGELQDNMTPIAVQALLKFSQWLLIQRKYQLTTPAGPE